MAFISFEVTSHQVGIARQINLKKQGLNLKNAATFYVKEPRTTTLM